MRARVANFVSNEQKCDHF